MYGTTITGKTHHRHDMAVEFSRKFGLLMYLLHYFTRTNCDVASLRVHRSQLLYTDRDQFRFGLVLCCFFWLVESLNAVDAFPPIFCVSSVRYCMVYASVIIQSVFVLYRALNDTFFALMYTTAGDDVLGLRSCARVCESRSFFSPHCPILTRFEDDRLRVCVFV